MLLLLLVLNVPGILIRQLVVLLRPLVHVGLRFVLSTLVVNLRVEHLTLLLCGPVFKSLFFRLGNLPLSIIEQVHEFLVY